jgi:V/A-type H+-transporting ATPase subunit A
MSGKLTKISGSLAIAEGVKKVKIADTVLVGEDELLGEVISISGESLTIQVYEDTDGLKNGDKVLATGSALTATLGPGLLGSVFDAIQRPLIKLRELVDNTEGNSTDGNSAGGNSTGGNGIKIPALDHERLWEFEPTVSEGDEVKGGSIIGTVRESKSLLHKIMVPRDIEGTIVTISQGEATIDDVICTIESSNGKVKKISMSQKWPIRTARPTFKKMLPVSPLYTGQRIIDTMLPITKGSTAAAVGVSAIGKSIVARQLAKWTAADVVVYVGVGRRGNEIADIISEFEELHDKRNDIPLIERSVIIANTSDMPVAARETAIYTGVTIAEYYRDMGYEVLLVTDSMTCWAEAMRLDCEKRGETPAEGGYPAYLTSRISQFFERSGYVECLGGDSRRGALTIFGVFSQPGGDTPDPVSHAAKRCVKTFLEFDPELAGLHHYPSISWVDSYSLNFDSLRFWYDKVFGADFLENSCKAQKLLQKEVELLEIAKSFGTESLSASDQLTLHTAKMVREDFLQQDAFAALDTFSSYEKQATLLSLILYYHDLCKDALSRRISDISALFKIPARELLGRAKMVRTEEFDEKFSKIAKDIEVQISQELRRQAEQKEEAND